MTRPQAGTIYLTAADRDFLGPAVENGGFIWDHYRRFRGMVTGHIPTERAARQFTERMYKAGLIFPPHKWYQGNPARVIGMQPLHTFTRQGYIFADAPYEVNRYPAEPAHLIAEFDALLKFWENPPAGYTMAGYKTDKRLEFERSYGLHRFARNAKKIHIPDIELDMVSQEHGAIEKWAIEVERTPKAKSQYAWIIPFLGECYDRIYYYASQKRYAYSIVERMIEEYAGSHIDKFRLLPLEDVTIWGAI